MRVLVTGATGLIGNAIARRCVADGHDVAVLTRPASDRSALPAGTHAVTGDVTSAGSLPPAVEGAEVVFHAAGLPEQWRRDDRDFDRVNRQGTADLLAACRDAGVRRVIYTSTMDVFRKDASGILREDQLDSETKPTAYERSKVAAEREVERHIEAGLDVVLLNPAATYGPSPTTTGTTRLFLRVAQGKVPMLPPGGMSVAYVGAVADAHVAAVERGTTGRRYLLADAFVSVREFARCIGDQLGGRRLPPTAPLWVLTLVAIASAPPARLFGVEPLVARGEVQFLQWGAEVDASRARSELGYQPVALEDGVARTIAHLRRSAAI